MSVSNRGQQIALLQVIHVTKQAINCTVYLNYCIFVSFRNLMVTTVPNLVKLARTTLIKGQIFANFLLVVIILLSQLLLRVYALYTLQRNNQPSNRSNTCVSYNEYHSISIPFRCFSLASKQLHRY